ncbi:hypothetical protein K461DRAFT_65394 [Myriangium duriaei CBS 260.36]|uniref:Mitochondrial distribution and morphology protein 12 n=1 Tax=Myriangium duriaei CBS 260.36 TaxID=1168546 RepID=A0A9P4MCA7_9PEZI|nr:hypothetical protein K461DRAFT_65394 [Myriangium duriaei CBS 260.36]
MSIEINWDTLTGGTDGAALAETIRAFIHDRFQKVPLPRMIRSVEVQSFSFGSSPPTITLKDVCDPLPDFYEDDEDTSEQPTPATAPPTAPLKPHRRPDATERDVPAGPRPLVDSSNGGNKRLSALLTDFPPRAATPRLAGSMSNLGYFHLPLSAGLSGTSTPLAAVAGARFPPWTATTNSQHSREASRGSITPPSASSRPTSAHDWAATEGEATEGEGTAAPHHEPAPEDMQVVARMEYDGDVKLSLTAEILLDYPTPSFVGIPLQLHITGLKFDGTAICAYIKRKAHFCFLAPEDAELLIDEGGGEEGGKPGGLIEEIRVESEIGQKEGGKQVLKNVGKVEKFVLEQVRRIFEEEFVWPSFWTFLV